MKKTIVRTAFVFAAAMFAQADTHLAIDRGPAV